MGLFQKMYLITKEIQTNLDMKIMRSWREIKVMLKWNFSVLSDTDFVIVKGDREGMLDKLAAKLNKTRPELESIFEELQKY